MCEKQNARLFKLRYRINGNENEAENKKWITKIRYK